MTRRLLYPDPPPAGTLLGPNRLGELLVVLGPDPDDPAWVLVGWATVPHIEAAVKRDPASLAELRDPRVLRARALAEIGARVMGGPS